MNHGDLVGVRIPHVRDRWGRIDYVQKNGLVVVEMWSPKCNRYAKGRYIIHPSFIHPMHRRTLRYV